MSSHCFSQRAALGHPSGDRGHPRLQFSFDSMPQVDMSRWPNLRVPWYR